MILHSVSVCVSVSVSVSMSVSVSVSVYVYVYVSGAYVRRERLTPIPTLHPHSSPSSIHLNHRISNCCPILFVQSKNPNPEIPSQSSDAANPHGEMSWTRLPQ